MKKLIGDCFIKVGVESPVMVNERRERSHAEVSAAADEKAAMERATSNCNESGSASCKVLYSSCTDPYFEKF